MVFKPDLGVNGMSGGRLRAHGGNVIRNVCEEQIKSAVNCALKSARKQAAPSRLSVNPARAGRRWAARGEAGGGAGCPGFLWAGRPPAHAPHARTHAALFKGSGLGSASRPGPVPSRSLSAPSGNLAAGAQGAAGSRAGGPGWAGGRRRGPAWWRGRPRAPGSPGSVRLEGREVACFYF